MFQGNTEALRLSQIPKSGGYVISNLDTGAIIPDTANEMEICSNGSTGVSTVENIISNAQECDNKINVV